MKMALRIASIVIALSALTGWLLMGAHPGWSRTSVPVRVLDEVTGIEGITYEKRFVPGLELLAAALFGSGLLAGASFFLRDQQTKQNRA